MRTIKYIPKVTSAQTQYREIDADDQIWLQTELIRWLAIMGELDMYHDADSKWVRDQWWHKRTATLPKGRLGQNTPASFVGGLLHNIMFGNQRDLTDKQMDAIQNISHIISQAAEGCTQVKFQIGFGVE
jgi:hypothetical protein